MARVFALDESHCNGELRSALQTNLRVYDECVALPQGHKSIETGSFKNVVINLSAHESELSADIFSPSWFSGVSAVEIPATAAKRLLDDPQKRAKMLKALADNIPSEMEMKNETVGPQLDCGDDDRDLKTWQCGFDSPGCCVGLYSAEHCRTTHPSNPGISRPHTSYFLVCKAGGGLAAQTFHARLSAALKKGMSLDEALAEGNSPGAQALRRVTLAGQRNRGRILALAAKVLGLHEVDTLNDTACCPGSNSRVAVTDVNVVVNSLRKSTANAGTLNASYSYFSSCVDTSASSGIMASSNVHEGFLLFVSGNGDYKINVKNEAFDSVPFSSVRVSSNKDAVMARAGDLKREADATGNHSEHPDEQWVRARFAWKGREFGVDVEPPPLLGTYLPENFSRLWCRELGLSDAQAIRLRPEIVCVSATEPSKLRAAARHVLGGK